MVVFAFLLISAVSAAIYGWKSDAVSSFPDFWKPALVMIAVFVGINIIYLLLVALVSLLIKPREERIKRQSGLGKLIVYLTSSLICTYSGARIHIIGKEKLPENERFLFICNHISGYDPLVFMAKLRKYNVSFISKPSNLKNTVVKNIAGSVGFLPIDRENNREALKTIITAAEYIKNDVCSIGIYPEGTRSKTGELGKFHNGSFKIATKAQAPVVVACVRGTEKIKDNIMKKRTDVYLEILDVIHSDKVCASGTAELSDYSRNLILEYQQQKNLTL